MPKTNVAVGQAVLVPRDDTFERQALRDQLLMILRNANENDAIGVCLSFLLHMAETNPGRLRHLLASTVFKDGRAPTRIVDVITLAAR